MWIAKVVSLTVLTPLAAMLAMGAVSACLTPSREAPKDPAPPASVDAKGSESTASPPNAGVDSPPPNAAQASAAANDPPPDPPAPPPNALDAPPSGPQRSVAQCQALWDGMQQKVERFDAAHSACKSDADCATVPGRACLGACDTAIPKGAVKEREALISKIGQNECTTFLDGCSRTLPIPVPSCPMYVPVCTGGKCTAKMK
jgi:hypothetical protein